MSVFKVNDSFSYCQLLKINAYLGIRVKIFAPGAEATISTYLQERVTIFCNHHGKLDICKHCKHL